MKGNICSQTVNLLCTTSIKPRLRTSPSNLEDFSVSFLFKYHAERVQCKGHSFVELNYICNVIETRDSFPLHCKVFHWCERSSVLPFTKWHLLTVRVEVETLNKARYFWESVMPSITPVKHPHNRNPSSKAWICVCVWTHFSPQQTVYCSNIK